MNTRTLTSTSVRTIAAVAVMSMTLGGCAVMQKASVLAGVDTAGEATCPVDVNTEFTGTMRIAYQQIANADLLVKDAGLLEACMPNATIQWSQFSSGGDVVQAFGSGSIDLGLAGSSPAVKAVSVPLNLPVSIVWIHDIIGKAESLVTRDSDVDSIEDLAGRTIAVSFSSTSHFSLLSALSATGMTNEDVNLINLAPDKMSAAWTRGEIDAAWVWDPVLGELEDAGGHVVMSSADTAAMGSATYDMEMATDEFVTGNPSVMETWTAVQDYAVGLIAEDPDSAAESISNQLGSSADVIRGQFGGYEYPDAVEQSDIFHGQLPATLKATAQFLRGQGELDEVNDDYADALYVDAIDAVASSGNE